MKTFLDTLAEELQRDYAGRFEEVAVIMPTQRTKRLLSQKLLEGADKPIFLPTILTINDFIESLSPYKKASQLELLLELHAVYAAMPHPQEFAEQFSHFLSWGTEFLADINQIDMQLQNADDIFTNLSGIKELDLTLFKSMDLSSMTNEKERQYCSKRLAYLNFYYSLKELYHRFGEALEKKKCAYEGFIYRMVAADIEKLSRRYDFTHYVFAGFNALTPAELQILKYYKQQGRAKFYFDLDAFYYDETIPTVVPNFPKSISDFIHIALKELALTSEEVAFVSHSYKEIPKNIRVIGVSKQMNQIRYAVNWLERMKREHPDELDEIAVVFADESLVVPFVNAYDCQDLNLTMGYPLQGLPVYSLLTALLRLLKSAEGQSGTSHLRFYHKDLLTLIQHPIVSKTFFAPRDYRTFEAMLLKTNMIYLSVSKLEEIMQAALAESEQRWADLVRFLKKLEEQWQAPLNAFAFFLKSLAERKAVSQLEVGVLEYVSTELEHISESVAVLPADLTIEVDSWAQLMNLQLGKLVLSMQGLPDKGIQVMGLLETRLLDFKHLLVLSVNDGIIPKKKSENSLILQEVKQYFHLPTYYERDAVFSYHFFRLLQRASNIDLVYDNDSSGNGVCEKSRLINQLRFKVKSLGWDNHIQWTEECENLLPDLSVHSEVPVVKKDEKLLEELRAFKFSPSSLHTYINCPLQFYLKHIKKMELYEKIDDKFDNALLGNVIHFVMQKVLENAGKNIEPPAEAVTKSKANIDALLEIAFQEQGYGKEQLQSGKNYILYQVCRLYLLDYLDKIIYELPFIRQFIGQELNLATTITIEGHPLTLIGKIDRVDRREDGIYILDYKTGSVKPENLKFKTSPENQEMWEQEWVSLFQNPDMDKLFQLLFYTLLYDEGLPAGKAMSAVNAEKADLYHAAIVGFRAMLKKQEEQYVFKVQPDVDKQMLAKFKEHLVRLLTEIVSPECDFVQTQDRAHCQYCDYKTFCLR